MKLTEEQAEVVNAALSSETPVFITGGAGTGKSVILRYVKNELSKSFRVFIAAPTGLAAENVEGVTIHSMFGLPTHLGAAVYDQFSRSEKYRAIATQMDVLLVDEVSMIRADIMNQIDQALQFHRSSTQPFGGVKVILFGDPYQLPPILKWEDKSTKWDFGGHKFDEKFKSKFFFSAKVIMNCGLKVFELQTSMRAAEDQPFVEVLNRVRVGKADQADLEFLISSSSKTLDTETSTHLYGKNDKVAERNNNKLDELPRIGERTFKARWFQNTNLSANPIRMGSLPESDSVEISLHLRIGARVLFNRNNGDIWRNGNLGTVTRLSDNSVQVRLDKNQHEVQVNRLRFDVREMVRDSTGRIYGDITGWYEQFPLRLGWALTVHKAQGQTLDAVVLDFDDQYFEEGQAYVALSRSRSISFIRFITPPTLKDLMGPNDYVKGFLTRFGVKAAKSHAEMVIDDLYLEAIQSCGYDHTEIDGLLDSFMAQPSKFTSKDAVRGHIIQIFKESGADKVRRFIKVVLLNEE